MIMKEKYYIEIINQLEETQAIVNKKIRNLSIYRLLTVVLGFIIFYQAFSYSSTVGMISLVVIISIFVWIVRLHNKLYLEREKNKNLLSIYNNEINLFKTTNIFGNGQNYKDSLHEYSSDLDIFGNYSVFNILNRSATYQGEKMLSNWMLSTSLDKKTIEQRQEVIKELSTKTKFKEKFISTVFIAEKTEKDDSKIKNWISVFKYYFTEKKSLKVLLYILSTLTLLLLLGGFRYPFLWSYSTLLLMINFLIVAKYTKNVNLVHEHISQQEDLFLKYSKLVGHIKNEKFNNSTLTHLQQKLLADNQIEKQLSLLSKLIKNLDFRLNIIMASVLNLLFFWDIHYTYKIEKWMKLNSPNIELWLDIIGEFDAYLSLSILYFNNEDWVFPEISEKEFFIEGKKIGHPLIEKQDRVTNDYNIDGKGNFDIVTGSNMAGKSTFLRTIGINSILALNGCPVCAESFTISKVRLITYMRIIDSLEDNLSTFHAELERIKSILAYVVKNDNCFLLLDELLRGTNSQDRHIGTVALIKQMMRNNASGIIATHDLALTDMILEYPNSIRNYNFGVKTKDNDLYFDYKLTNGVCDSFNASILMKKIGIDIDLVNND